MPSKYWQELDWQDEMQPNIDKIIHAKCHPNIDKMQDEATYIVQPNVKLVSELWAWSNENE